MSGTHDWPQGDEPVLAAAGNPSASYSDLLGRLAKASRTADELDLILAAVRSKVGLYWSDPSVLLPAEWDWVRRQLDGAAVRAHQLAEQLQP